MPRQLRAQIHGFLHDYKKLAFELEHGPEAIERRRQAAGKFVNELLDQKFHYHLHKEVNPQRADTIQLIHNYCREALLPPVVQRLAERLLLLEERHEATLKLVGEVLQKLSAEIQKETRHSG